MDESIKMRLLAKLPIDLGVCKIYSPTLREMVELGWYEYNLGLSNLIAEPTDYNIKDIDLSQYQTWDILQYIMDSGGENRRKEILGYLEFFIKEKVLFKDNVCIVGDESKNNIIDNSNYENIKQSLKYANCIFEKSKEDEFNPHNKKAIEIQEKINKYKNMMEEKNKTTLYDLISIHASNSKNLNIDNIWNLSYFQFNNQFLVTQNIEDYHINIRALLAGAKASDIDLKHYIRPVNFN